MSNGSQIARVAALIGDPARATMLLALQRDGARTVGDLGRAAGIGKSTASVHLSKLTAAGLVDRSKEGRHLYHTLSGQQVHAALDALGALADPADGATDDLPETDQVTVQAAEETADLRYARVCYDYLAGDMGVAMLDGLLRRRALISRRGRVALTRAGAAHLAAVGLDISGIRSSRRATCTAGLDWSSRRPHLAGGLGAALWTRIQGMGWVASIAPNRAVRFTEDGEARFRRAFQIG
ncbi:MAG: helix-turn-helix transcriptional regulator [Pseudomonadota bacterium]